MIVKVTLNLPEPIAETIKDLALKNNVSRTEIIRRAIAREKFIADQIQNGGTFILKKANGNMKEILFDNAST